MPILYDSQNKVSNGGTELVMRALESRMPKDILDKVFVSRNIGLFKDVSDENARVLWTHEVPDMRAGFYNDFLCFTQKKWELFDRTVFVSNWQMLEYIKAFNLQWSDWPKLKVIHNAIVPIEEHEKPKDKIRLIYTSNPIRGLDILYKAFVVLAEKYPELELEVFSSFELYNVDADKKLNYDELFQNLQKHPQVVYHGASSNEEVREGLKRSHIFAYPSIWGETSCISLIEAMSAKLLCVHPNNAALFETSANWTNMYHYEDNMDNHVEIFIENLDKAIQQYKRGDIAHLELQSKYVKYAHGWERKAKEWEEFLRDLIGAKSCT